MKINSEPTRRQLIEERDAYKIRAQHMDELVEAVDVALSLLNFNKDYGAVQAETVRVTLAPLRDILAKIKGDAK